MVAAIAVLRGRRLAGRYKKLGNPSMYFTK